jgi:nitrate reductase NapE
MDENSKLPTKAQEMRAFFVITVIAAPILAIATVGGYGFFIWMYQLVTGTLPSG